VHFVFAGDGPMRDELKRQVNSLGVQNHIHFLGFRNDVETLLRNFDLFILPSLYEGLPNVVLEAMASRLPVIATEVDGTPEAVIHSVTGLLIPPCSPKAIEQAICSLLNDRKLLEAMGNAGRNRVETYFSLETQVYQFIQLYQSLFIQGGL
jgi:glycosyltransferase involved in cell wall biosynthesis